MMIVITLRKREELIAFHFGGLWLVNHLSWIVCFPLGVIGRLYCVIFALPGHLLYNCSNRAFF